MCGFLFHNFAEIAHSIPKSLLEHRGPDNYSVMSRGDYFFHHWRLSILDLSTNANQPISSEDFRYTMIYNGEIYNFKELRKDLERDYDYTFKTTSDTEVLFYGLIFEGKQFIPKLNGMFSFVFYDQEKDELTVARDFFGIKPLYYYYNRDKVIFSSEISPFHYLEGSTRELSGDVQVEVLSCGYVSGKNTIYKGIYKLEPGSILTLSFSSSECSLDTESYHPNFDSFLARNASESLFKSISGQVLSDVPLGVLNSGGIDSGLVSYLVGSRKEVDNKIYSFTATFKKNPSIDESRDARSVALKSGLSHIEVELENSKLGKELKRLILFNKEVLVHPNSYNIYLLGERAKDKVKVLLSGEGSDELFQGYNIFRVVPFLKYKLGRRLISWIKNNQHPYGYFFLSNNLLDVYRLKYNYLHPEYLNVLTLTYPELSTSLANRERLYNAAYLKYGFSKAGFSFLERKLYLPPLLDRQDRMLMRSSIEGRVPFLDNYVFSYVQNNNANLSNVFHGKLELRKLFNGIFNFSKQKFAFATPLSEYVSALESEINFRECAEAYCAAFTIDYNLFTKIYEKGSDQVKWIFLNVLILHSNLAV
jgi:asparagine synthase (glutamine-hydrolysing)